MIVHFLLPSQALLRKNLPNYLMILKSRIFTHKSGNANTTVSMVIGIRLSAKAYKDISIELGFKDIADIVAQKFSKFILYIVWKLL
jgi:hypothetical protein